jgi:hypothetical protein
MLGARRCRQSDSEKSGSCGHEKGKNHEIGMSFCGIGGLCQENRVIVCYVGRPALEAERQQETRVLRGMAR